MAVKAYIRLIIAGYKINAVSGVSIETSRRNIADTATIQLPMRSFNAYNKLGKLIADGTINEGDTVSLTVGYETYEKVEFLGYISRIERSTPAVIYCEDKAWHWKLSTINKVWNEPVSLREVLNFVCTQYETSFSGSLPKLTFDSFKIENQNGYEFLQTLKEQWGLTSYFKDEILHTELISEVGNMVSKFAYGINVSAVNLKKRNADNKVLIKLKAYQKDNTYIEAEAGEKGGSVIEKITFGISDKSKLAEIAKAELQALNISGYEGSFTSWLFQPVKHSTKVEYTDTNGETATYLVESVKTTFDTKGGKQEIAIGKQL